VYTQCATYVGIRKSSNGTTIVQQQKRYATLTTAAKSLKNRRRPIQIRPPPIEKKGTSGSGYSSQARYSTQILHSSNNFFYLCDSPFKNMIMIGRKLGIGNSIYQGGYAGGDGLTVKDGRLINNRADGQSGIAQMAKLRKEAKREEKVSMIAEGYSRGEMMAEAREMMMDAMSKPFKLKL